ncbi:ribosome maturation factor RimP [Streptomyces sp. SID3343]|uniref:ribosome maturation factor RimP n=1 Tax=Streptomyces sp. SID3343 TaxID=2690260 RepID=UPI001371A127|nr:ribosome maturation factor RimP [Streptomyces sp. SID3343]MYW01682.1 ribosome maturation factor RimP [Streptomyces sp. SID3343]
MSTTTLDRLRELLEPVVTTAGVDLEDLALSAAGKRRVLRVIVAADDGVDLDKVAEVSRTVADTLDASDVMGALGYTLEVTTPGVDRPLTLERHWRRAADRLVLAQLHDGTTVTGRVGKADAEGVELDVDGKPRRLAYDAVAKATVQVEFNRKKTDVGDIDVDDVDEDLDDDVEAGDEDDVETDDDNDDTVTGDNTDGEA